MRTVLVLVCLSALSPPSWCAPEWTYTFDASGPAELSGWRPWSFPARSEVVQRKQAGLVELTSSGRAFALHRDLSLSGAKGYTVAFQGRVTATGPPHILRCQAYLDWRVAERTRFRLVWAAPREAEFSDGTVGLLGRSGLVGQARLAKTEDRVHTYWIRGSAQGVELWIDRLAGEPDLVYRGRGLSPRGRPGLTWGDDNGGNGPAVFGLERIRVCENGALPPLANSAGLAVANTADDARLKWQPWVSADQFAIGAWEAFHERGGNATPERVRCYREAGCNVMCAADAESIDLGRQEGLAMLVMGQWAWQRGGNYFEQWFKLANAYPDVGYLLWDEPQEEHVPLLARRVRRLNKHDPSRMVWINLLPQHSWGQSYALKVERYANRVQPPILSYDFYAPLIDGTDHPEFYANMEAIRTLASEHSVPWWGFALVVRHFSYREPSETDLRWQVYALLTHGAKGVWYFTYSGGWGNVGLVDREGKPTHLYSYARAINQEIRSMESTLVSLRSAHIGHVGRPTPFATKFHPAPSELITAVEAEHALIGQFVDSDGTDYVMAMNKDHGPDVAAEATQTILLRFAASVRQVSPVGKTASSSDWAFEVNTHTLRCEVPAGTGCLFGVK